MTTLLCYYLYEILNLDNKGLEHLIYGLFMIFENVHQISKTLQIYDWKVPRLRKKT